MPAKLDLLGQKFGRLTVIGETTERDFSFVVWACRCDCGAAVLTSSNALRQGVTRSCGCLRKDMRVAGNVTHGGARGKRKERLYRLWKGMRQRCSNKKLAFAHRYVLRGIKVCDEWQNDYAAFREWALANGYRDDLSLDRIDPDGNYTPENCRWADWITQQNNRANNTRITVNGEHLTLAQAKRKYGIPTELHWKRRNRGWTERQALQPRMKAWDRHKMK